MSRSILAAVLVSAAALLATNEAHATDGPVAVGEVSSASVDAAAIRDTAEGELKQMDTSGLPARHRYVVSLALRGAVEGAVAWTVNAMLRDAKTGVMIAIIEAGARAEGAASEEDRNRVAHAAVRSAMRRIPRALGGK